MFFNKLGLSAKILALFLSLAVVSLVTIGIIALNQMQTVGELALEVSASLGEQAADDSAEALHELGAQIIEQKAEDIAKQAEIYLATNPGLSLGDLQNDLFFQQIVVQELGGKGYTAMFCANTLVLRFHPELIDVDFHTLADEFPSMWAIIKASQGGKTSAGYYQFPDAEGLVQDKYMHIAPVAAKTSDNVSFNIAATTYIDEFSKPVQETTARIESAMLTGEEMLRTREANLRYTFVGIFIIILLIVVLLARWFAGTISKPLYSLTKATKKMERGELTEEEIQQLGQNQSNDEIATLSRVFAKMATEVKARESRLKKQVAEMRIEIDQNKKTRQVAEITETEYFQTLKQRAKEMRGRKEK